MRVDGQDEIQGDFEEEMVVEVDLQEKVGFSSGSKSSGPSQDGGNKEQEKAEDRRHQGMRGSATRSGDGNSLQGVGCHLQQEMSEQEAAGLSFLRLANPLIGVFVKASAKLSESEQYKLKEGWVAVKKALD